MKLNQTALAVALSLLGALFAPVATADETYPDRTIRIVVPFAAGGGVDIVSRLVAAQMTEALGQSVIVENHPGGSTMIGTQVVVSAPPDGYTLLLGSTSLSSNPALRPDELPYDTLEDLRPVSLLSVQPYVILVSNAIAERLEIGTLEDLLRIARERPGELTAGSPGIASGGHLAMELFGEAAGVQFTHVPYSGASASGTLDLVAGRLDVQFATILSVLSFIEAGSVVPLAVTTATRSPTLPDLPAAAELVPDYQASSWNSILVPAATPDAIVERLNAAINEAVYSDAVSEALSREGAVPSAGTVEEMQAFLLEEIERWSGVVERTGIRAE